MNKFSLSYRGNSTSPKRDQLFPSSSGRSNSARYYNNRRTQFSMQIEKVVERLKRSRMTRVQVLCVVWVVLIYYGERIYPRQAIRQCSWYNGYSSSGNVALIADPQLIDDNTYPGRPALLLAITKFVVDLYLRRNWVNINKILDPDTNIFLGDLFDGGREWGDRVWNEEFIRYNKIFTKPPFKKAVMSLPGNHDIGYGNDIVPHALGRFEAFFGPGSSTVEVGNHTFVLLDTISMLNQNNASIYEPPRYFMEKVGATPHTGPRILLTHVPLYRPPDHSCGKLREHGDKALAYIRGKQYQTLVNPEVSAKILETIEPVGVFSGDDHDACHVEHKYNSRGIERKVDEFTVKSISMAMGIFQPGIQLVTLDHTASDPYGASYHTSICYMPSPFYAFILYGVMAVVSLAILIFWNPQVSTESSYLPVYSNDPEGKWKPSKRETVSPTIFIKQTLLILSVILVCYFYLAWSIYN